MTKVICDRTKCSYCDEDTLECELSIIALREDGTCACYRNYEREVANQKAINHAREMLSMTCQCLAGEVFSALKAANYKAIKFGTKENVLFENAVCYLDVLKVANVIEGNVYIPHPHNIAQSIRLLKQKHQKFNAVNLEKVYKKRHPEQKIYSEMFNGFGA